MRRELPEDKIRSVLRNAKNKAPGIDNKTGELLKADIEASTKWLKKLSGDKKRMVKRDDTNKNTEEE